MKRKTKVEYKRFRSYWGKAIIRQPNERGNHIIQLSTKIEGKLHLEVLIHEKLHIMFPDLEEYKIEELGKDMCEVIWSEGYRRK